VSEVYDYALHQKLFAMVDAFRQTNPGRGVLVIVPPAVDGGALMSASNMTPEGRRQALQDALSDFHKEEDDGA
jgi:hypothetical protein